MSHRPPRAFLEPNDPGSSSRGACRTSIETRASAGTKEHTMSKLMKIFVAGGAIAALALASAPAQAGTAASNMAVSMNVNANCTISAGNLAFGSYDPVTANASTPLNGSALLTLNCTNGATTKITLGQGANANAGSTDAAPLRRSKAGSNYLTYSLFSDSGRTTTWGNTAATAFDYVGTGASDSSVVVYGQVAAGQNVPGGAYSDTVIATVTF